MENVRAREKTEESIYKGLLINADYVSLGEEKGDILDFIKSRITGEAIGVRCLYDDYWSTGYGKGSFVGFSDEIEEVKNKVDNLSENMVYLRNEVLSCKECMDKISEELGERPIVKETGLFEIGEGVEVIQPIPIIIEEYADEVIASFPEIEVFGCGSVESESIGNLKEEIRKMYFELENIPDDKLGKLPRSWKRVLIKVVKKNGIA